MHCLMLFCCAMLLCAYVVCSDVKVTVTKSAKNVDADGNSSTLPVSNSSAYVIRSVNIASIPVMRCDVKVIAELFLKKCLHDDCSRSPHAALFASYMLTMLLDASYHLRVLMTSRTAALTSCCCCC
jgi:hypothetical protein